MFRLSASTIHFCFLTEPIRSEYIARPCVWNKSFCPKNKTDVQYENMYYTYARLPHTPYPVNLFKANSLLIAFFSITRTWHTKSSTTHESFQRKTSTTRSRNLWICGQRRVKLSSSASLTPTQKPISWSSSCLVTMETAGQRTALGKSWLMHSFRLITKVCFVK